MSENIEISVYEVVGSALCVASDDGQKVHDRIAKAITEKKEVTISFKNIESLTSAFLNTAIGQLYGNFKDEQVREYLNVIEMEPDDLSLLKRVVDTAKLYFDDPERFKDATQEVLGDDE